MKNLKLLALLVVAIVIVAGAGAVLLLAEDNDNDSDTGTTMVVKDDRNINVTVPKEPARIVSLGTAYTEILFTIGAGDQVVGVDKSSNYPAEVVERIGNETLTNVGSYFTLNLEAVLALQPDLVITWTHAGSTISALENVNVTVVAFDPKSVSDVMRVISTIGNITDHKSEAKEVVEDMRDKIEYVASVISNIDDSDKPKVYMELLSSGGKSPGPGTITDDVIRMAGGVNINSNASARYTKLSSEYVIGADPDFIILEMQNTKTDDDIAAQAGWSSITAVEEDQIMRIDGAQLTASPRIVLALLQFADWFYPELIDS